MCHAKLITPLTQSSQCSGQQIDFASNRSRVQIPAEQIFSIESINFNVRFLILQFCLWYFFFSFLRLCQPNLSLLYIPFFDVILFYFLTKLPTMVGSKSLNLFKMERKFSKFAQMGLNLSNSIHTCPNWSKLVQIGLNQSKKNPCTHVWEESTQTNRVNFKKFQLLQTHFLKGLSNFSFYFHSTY